MKKRIFIFLNSLLIFILSINPLYTYAYDKNSYNYSNGYYYVDNLEKHTSDNQITLKLLIPKNSILEGKFFYDFKCLSNNFSDSDIYNDLGYQLMRYEARFDTVYEENVEQTDFGDLLTFKFNVENGKYVFSTNDYANNICTLTSDYTSPLTTSIDYSSNEKYKMSIREYPVELNNESLTLYAIYGADDFIEENIKSLINFIKGNNTSSVGETSKKNETRKELQDVLSSSNLSDESDINDLIYGLVDDDSSYKDYDERVNEITDDSAINTSSDTVKIKNSSEKKENNNIVIKKKSHIYNYIYLGLTAIVVGTIIVIVIIKKKRG